LYVGSAIEKGSCKFAVRPLFTAIAVFQNQAF
jgi:hypothetical protein